MILHGKVTKIDGAWPNPMFETIDIGGEQGGTTGLRWVIKFLDNKQLGLAYGQEVEITLTPKGNSDAERTQAG